MADVGADDGLGAERAQLLSEFGMSVAMAAGNDDLIALAGEGQGRSAADPGGPSR
jgi:hypothetical protein